MKTNRVSHVPFTQRVGRYHSHMLQAKLSTPVNPVFRYNLQPYYARQQQWTTELSDSLSRLYRFSSDLEKSARELIAQGKENEAGPDIEQLHERTHSLVSKYNRLQLLLTEKADTLTTQKLDAFAQVAKDAEEILQTFGIKLLPDGQLEMDDEKWLEAVATRYVDYTNTMENVAQAFRAGTFGLQSKPLGSFSRYYEEAMALHPYIASSSSLHYQHVAKTGLYVNERW
ncbi:hypothetical protein ACFYU8_09365 [Brevibacillus sp. NPDC003359]|uniref:hypothetical protein n=1 Tax=unclassified Brevibacillus TaxID=2684853 RepID=UPI0036C6D9F7